MSRPKSILPKYCVHRRSGRGFVTLNGRQVQLGKAGTPESRDAYDKVIGEWFANSRTLPVQASANDVEASEGPTLTMMLDAFWRHAEAYYVQPVIGPDGLALIGTDGAPVTGPSSELEHYRVLVRILRRMYGGMAAASFGCPELDAIRARVILPSGESDTGKESPGWTRQHANRQVGRIRRIFRWAVTKRLVPASVPAALDMLEGLRKGKSPAREAPKVGPVDKDRALAIIPFVAPPVAAMIRLQLFTGMRSTELCIMRPCDIDRSGKPWIYRPMFHKTMNHGIAREIPIGPKARKIIKSFLLNRDPEQFLFSPIEADAHRRKVARENRKTHVQPSQVLRSQLAKRRKKQRQLHPRYDHKTYYRAVMYGCEQAFKMPAELKYNRLDAPDVRRDKSKRRWDWYRQHAWHPHMVRHRTATDLRRRGGLESAQIVLGHADRKTTLLYAEADVRKAHRIMERTG